MCLLDGFIALSTAPADLPAATLAVLADEIKWQRKPAKVFPQVDALVASRTKFVSRLPGGQVLSNTFVTHGLLC